MISRRAFLQATAALSLAGVGSIRHAAAAQRLTQADLLAFKPVGQVTLLHLTDLHAQLQPILFREPSVNIGVGDAKGRPPHLTEAAFRKAFGIAAGSPDAYALTSEDFVALAHEYGRMGGLDRIATLVHAIRAERGADRVLLLDGGDTWHGSWTALQTRGADMVECMALLKPDAMVGHFEFTLGQDRVKELAGKQAFPFLAGNVVDNEWKEPVFDAYRIVERGGVRIGVIGQAFPSPRSPTRAGWCRTGRSASRKTASAPMSRQCGPRAPRWSCCCRITGSTSTARWRGGSRASTSSCPATPTTRCRSRSPSARR